MTHSFFYIEIFVLDFLEHNHLYVCIFVYYVLFYIHA